jgi:hypothetical protein
VRRSLRRQRLNNRRANLRICTLQENSCNKHGKRKFIGVYPHGKSGKYQGQIMKQGKSYHTRLFDDPLDVALARDRLAIQLHGPFAYLNFPEEAQANGEPPQPPDPQPAPPTTGHCIVRMPIWRSPKPKTAPPKDAQ